MASWRNTLGMLVLMLSLLPLSALSKDETTLSLSYDKENFSLSFNGKNELVIRTSDPKTFFKDDMDHPALPFVSVSVLAPPGKTLASFNADAHKVKIMDDVVLPLNPLPRTCGVVEGNRKPDHKQEVFPRQTVEFAGVQDIAGHNILQFLVSPFGYDAGEKRLYFHDSVTLTVDFGDSLGANQNPVRGHMDDIIAHMVVNPEQLQDYPAEQEIDDPVDYVIVTSESLATSFEPLAEWKNRKGIRTKIVTTQEIYQLYPEYIYGSKALRIKHYLFDMYINHQLKYVLLGGDAYSIPVIKCNIYNFNENRVPADLFYASFGGDFNWNSSNAFLCGQNTNIDYGPDLFLTRIPVQSEEHVDAFVDKTLFYEKTPSSYGWSHELLMCGMMTHEMAQSPHGPASDSEVLCDSVYNAFINFNNNWVDRGGTTFRLFDTYCDSIEYRSHVNNFVDIHFDNALNCGKAFVKVSTHGDVDHWVTENGEYHYEPRCADDGIQPSIITTIACHTNAFDSQTDPCLSESFMRDPYNGVVAYLGASRESYMGDLNGNDPLGPSYKYDGMFYYHLLCDDYGTKNYGKMTAAMKASMVSTCSTDIYRWVHLGLNPLGDPEMPVFTRTPRQFPSPGFSINTNGYEFGVNVGVDSCTICAVTQNDFSAVFADTTPSDTAYYKIFRDVREATFSNVHGAVSVVITKQNYIPLVLTVPVIEPIGGPIIDFMPVNVSSVGDIINRNPAIEVERNSITVNSVDDGKLRIYDTMGRIVHQESISPGTTSVDISGLPCGVFAVRVNNKTKKFIKN